MPLGGAALSGQLSGDADGIFYGLYGHLRELGWLGTDTTVVIVGDGAEWIWNRATWFVRRCEILDFWHAVEHAWAFARLRYGDGSAQADLWVRVIAQDLRAGKVQDVIARLKRLRLEDIASCSGYGAPFTRAGPFGASSATGSREAGSAGAVSGSGPDGPDTSRDTAAANPATV
jgi:hypothetical protein